MVPSKNKQYTLLIALGIVFSIIVIKLFIIQIIDDSYKINAENNALRYQTRYPARGLILDRNGKIIVDNKNIYDIIVTPYDVKAFDTLALCRIFSLDEKQVKETFAYYRKNRRRIGYQSQIFLKQVSDKEYSLFMEQQYKFPGFTGVSKTIRKYPVHAGGNLLGYVTEVDPEFIKKNPEYQPGDLVGRTGLEESCELKLRGEKGYSIFLRDARNRIQAPYADGAYNKKAVPGENVISTIDADLQSYGEILMKNKVGSIVAIEPSSGEILTMVSSPGVDVSILASISKYYKEITTDPFMPMFNRAVMSPQPPGSVFKLVNALIGLQEGVITPETRYGCSQGFFFRGIKVGCHNHLSPLDLQQSIMMSCNAYYCNVLRAIVDNPSYPRRDSAFNHWRKKVTSFGFGTKLGSDFPSEQGGIVPSSGMYDRFYGKGRWNALTVISLSIGQGELGCTPLHLANLAAAIANRGYFYTPHIIKKFGSSPIDPKYREKRYTLIDSTHFRPVIEGMYRAVNSGPGSGATARIAALPGLDVCGKTGTAQNPHGDDHSVFICFAPKDDPKIAVAVYVENAGFGGTWAAPIASLIVEKYLNGRIAENRSYVEQRILEADLLHKVPAYRKSKENLKK